MRKLTNLVKSKLHNISCRVLLIHSTHDKTSLMKNLDYLTKVIDNSILDTLVVNRSSHALFDSSPDQEQIFNRCIKFLKNEL